MERLSTYLEREKRRAEKAAELAADEADRAAGRPAGRFMTKAEMDARRAIYDAERRRRGW